MAPHGIIHTVLLFLSGGRRAPALLAALAATAFLTWIAPAAHAQEVITDSGGTNATAIQNLELLGDLYDVTFVAETAGSDNVYGRPPASTSTFRESWSR